MPEAEHMRRVAESGGIALANVRTGGDAGGSGHLTLGAGDRAMAGALSGLAFSSMDTYETEAVDHLYQALMGRPAGPGIVHLGFAELAGTSEQANRRASPGTLGQALLEAGIPVAVYGNADTYSELKRYGVLVGMDRTGQVQRGSVGAEVLVRDEAFPFALRTDYTTISDHLERHIGSAGFVVVELGDLARLEDVATFVLPTQMASVRLATLARIDELVQRLVQAIVRSQYPSVLFIVVPTPAAADARAGFLMSPLLMGQFPGGLALSNPNGVLSSPTTRRPAITANYDLTATVLHLFGLPHDGLAGRPLTVEARADAWGEVTQLYERVTRVHSQRLPIIQPYFFIQLAAVLLSALLIAGSLHVRRRVRVWRKIALIVHLGLVSFPLTLLILPLLPGASSMLIVWLQVLCVTGILVLTGWAFRHKGAAIPFVVISALTTLALAIDTATGAQIMQASHLGYDPIGGSRYYGIGNEYMGVWLGSAAITAGGLLDIASPGRRRAIIWGISMGFAAIVVLLASPRHGANVGGTIGAVIGLGVVLTLFIKERLRLRDLVVLGALLAAVLVTASWYDASVSGPGSSHLGNAVQQVGAEGGDPLWLMFERKLSMNARLIRLTIWSRAFFVSLVSSVIFAFYPPRLVSTLILRYPSVGFAIRGSLLGALVVLLANDSGIVAAATLMIPVISTLLYLMLCLAEGGNDTELR